ncbi:hypothetical protein B0H13DRAFT_1032531 [Mycena leptocephala]|nr:hypothetical protein B0H13DRAFT_1032531 [Mycena leptocephala]
MTNSQTEFHSEPEYAKSGLNKADYPWYLANIDKHLVPETQKLLETYSGIPLAQQSEHVHKIRDQAWAIRAYPCTGQGVWLVPFISRSPAYETVLSRLQAGGVFLDVGCFLGGDMRRLAIDGAPSEQLHGVDIVSHWDVGYSLYRDRDRFKAHFIEGDFLSTENPALTALHGRVDVLSVSAVLHHWDFRQQRAAVERLVSFTAGPGSIVLGYQVGNVEAKEVSKVFGGAALPTIYLHDPASFAKMWREVSTTTGTKWDIKARLLRWEDVGWDPKDLTWMEPAIVY